MKSILLKWFLKKANISYLNWKRFLAMYYPNAKVRKKNWIETFVEIGEGSFLNPNVVVVDDYHSKEILVKIGKNCSISPGVVFVAYSSHNNSKILRASGLLKNYEKKEPIIIGNDVWIGANSTILPGIKIGDCSIIGANSLVNKDISEYSLAYGVPIKVIKDIRSN